MGLLDYSSRQPNQKAKVTNKFDGKFAVATTTRIRHNLNVKFSEKSVASQHYCN